MAKHCRIELLGQLRLRVGDTAVTRFRTYKTGALLACLAYKLGRPAPREELVEMLWPDSTEDQARNSLSQSLSSLRNQLEPLGIANGSVLEASRHTVCLHSEAVETDVDEFRDLSKTADQAHARGNEAVWEARAREAVALFQGEFLPGVYEDWTLLPREHLREEALGILDKLTAVATTRGELREALSFALQATTIDPTREASHQAAIKLYDALGQPDAAVRQYRELERNLFSQLGLKPTEGTRSLVKQSLQRAREAPELLTTEPLAGTGEPEGTPTWALSEPNTALDTVAAKHRGRTARAGVWRFPSAASALAFARQVRRKDPSLSLTLVTSDRAEGLSVTDAALGQILGDEATAALTKGHWVDLGLFETTSGRQRLFATTETADRPRLQKPDSSSVPAALTKFFGREDVLVEVQGLLTLGKTRLVTLTGPGGIGKTRLSQEVARGIVDHFPRGTKFVKLEDLVQGAQVWDAVASSFGVVGSPKMSTRDQVLASLEGGPSLLVFDNFEQLVESGGPVVVADLLTSLPECHILASSRRRLGVEGETEVALTPLPDPSEADSLEQAQQSPAVALFLDRARTARPDFHLTESNREAVVLLCHRLEGIPLALELAAARAQVLSPSQILERFDQRLDLLSSRGKVERHRSLRAAIDWTYEILADDLKSAFRRLSVFRGGWDEETAEPVLGSPVTLDVLAELRDLSLITSSEGSDGRIRFGMLETLRTYAWLQGSEEERDEARDRHVRSVLALLEASEPKLEGPDQITVLVRLEDDYANVRAAVERAVESRDADTALRLCAAAWRFWHLRSHLEDGRDHCAKALALQGGDSVVRAKALNGAGRLAYLQGDYDLSRKLHDEALDLAGGDASVKAMSMNALGAVAYEKGKYADAVVLFEECLALRRGQGDLFGVGNSLSWLGIVYTDQSRYDDATKVLEESLEVRRKIGDVSGIARALNSLGIVARRLLDLPRAASLYEEALEIQRRMGDRRAIAGLLSNLGMVSHALGETDRARGLFVEAQQTNVEIGDKWGTATVLANLAAIALDSGDTAAALTLNAEALKLRHGIGNQWGVAFSLEGCARALLASGRPQEAVRALAAASRIREDMGSPLPPADQASVDTAVAQAKSGLDKKAFGTLWSEGRVLALDDVVEATLTVLRATD